MGCPEYELSLIKPFSWKIIETFGVYKCEYPYEMQIFFFEVYGNALAPRTYRVSKLSRGTLCNPSYIKFFVIIFLNINCNVY